MKQWPLLHAQKVKGRLVLANLGGELYSFSRKNRRYRIKNAQNNVFPLQKVNGCNLLNKENMFLMYARRLDNSLEVVIDTMADSFEFQLKLGESVAIHDPNYQTILVPLPTRNFK
jgi:hypothetical protein